LLIWAIPAATHEADRILGPVRCWPEAHRRA
jgi:hypothetical protein